METTVKLELDAGHAWALALFLKRVGWSDIRSNAQDDQEAYPALPWSRSRPSGRQV